MPIIEVDDFKTAVKEPVVKVLMNKEAERLVEVEKKILQKQLEGQLSVMRSKPFFLEFTEHGVTKGTSLNQLIQKLGIKREEVIAMGDRYDQAMIEFAGLGVAMGNAPDDIKEIANYVTDTNMNDGVAKVVEKFVLKTEVLV